MKRTLLLAALASMALASPGLAAEIPATLKIEEVTVNPRGAQLVRIGEVELPAGSHEIIIDTLPANIDASSVQVQGRSTLSTEIGAVDVSLKVVDPAAESATQRKQLEAEIEALGRDRERQQQALSDAEFRRNTLERLTGGFGAVPYATGDKPAMGPEQIRALLALTSEELEATSQALLNARTALDKIDERINLLQRKLQELASAPRPGHGLPSRSTQPRRAPCLCRSATRYRTLAGVRFMMRGFPCRRMLAARQSWNW